MDAQNFGEYLRSLRLARKLSINQLAERTGISAAHISRLERSMREIPRPDTLRKLALGLGVPFDELVRAAGYSEEQFEYNTKVLSRRLQILRESKGLSTSEVAEKAGISETYLARLESSDSRLPGVSTLHRLAQIFDVTPAYLVGDTADPKDNGPLDAWYQPKDLVQWLEESEVMFEGHPLSDDDKLKIKQILAAVFMDAKRRNQRK